MVIPESFINYSSHCPFKLHKYVLEALEASVTYSPVRLKITQLSIVPNLALFYCTANRTASTFSIIHIILNKVKQADTGKPVFYLNSPCFCLNLSQTSAQRLSHQTIALNKGMPFSSQQTTVYLWLVTPTPKRVVLFSMIPFSFACSTAPLIQSLTLLIICRGLCSNHPSALQICSCSIRCLAISPPSVENTENLVDVVD